MGPIVDSSVLIAALHEDDSQHARGRSALAGAPRPIIIPEYIALETSTMLMVRKHKRSADIFLRALLRNDEFVFLPSSPTLFASATRLFLSMNKRLSFVDCALVALSREYTILTFDSALMRAIRAAADG